MLKSRKKRHVDYIGDRIFQLHNEIVKQVMHENIIDLERIEFKKELVKKYRRRWILLKA